MFFSNIKMTSVLFPASLLNSTTIIIFIFIAIIKTSYCLDDEIFTECKLRTYSCGNSIRNMGYPFWGNGRPHICGAQGFELRCLDNNNHTVIDIESQEFRVLSINPLVNTMTIARMDMWDSTCPQKFRNTTLNLTLFEPISTNIDVGIYYGCAAEAGLNMPNYTNFTCAIDGMESDIGFYDESSPKAAEVLNREMCNISITVPVLADVFVELGAGRETLQAALNRGFDVEYQIDKKACGECKDSGGNCGSSNSTSLFICYCSDQSHSLSCPIQGGRILIRSKILLGIGAGIIGILVTCICICCFKRKVSSYSMVFWRGRTTNDQNIEAFIRNYGSLAPKRYSYSEVKKITSSFKDKLGQGGYGNVYKGKLLDGCLVAVKVLKASEGNGEEFINEVASISKTSHVNIVALLGFCIEGKKRALIYEFMPNGSLEKFIYNENPLKNGRQLDWEKLHQITAGIARGLEYLHRGCNTRILHFDIKPHNILLDEAFCPKISDFGLAKLCPRKESIISMLGARGTIGYIAPEVFSRNFGGVSHKSDVYSYGMMVLEMVGGRKNIDVGVGMGHTSEIYFPHWVYKRLELDHNLELQGVMSEEDNIIARKMVLIGLWCIQTDPSHRPSMGEVMNMLEGRLDDLQFPPKPFLSSPPRSPSNPSTFSTSSMS